VKIGQLEENFKTKITHTRIQRSQIHILSEVMLPEESQRRK